MSLRKTTFIEFLLTPAMHKTTVLLETTSYIFLINITKVSRCLPHNFSFGYFKCFPINIMNMNK